MRKRPQSPTDIYHWICRGVNKKELFHDAEDYKVFKILIRRYKEKYQIKLHHYCLMKNHVHLLIHSAASANMGNFSHYVCRHYAAYYGRRYEWQGQVFRRPYKSFPVENDTYLLECGRYIERNPIKAGLCDRPENYPYSSFGCYVAGDTGDLPIDPSPAYLALAADNRARIDQYRSFVTTPRTHEPLESINLNLLVT